MLDRKRYAEWLERANGKDVTRFLSVSRDIAPLGERLLELGAKVVMIKSGAPGMYYCTAGKDAIARIEKKLGFLSRILPIGRVSSAATKQNVSAPAQAPAIPALPPS